MLNKRKANFAELVWTAAGDVGRNAPAIADKIIKSAFPLTYEEAEIEGASAMLRTGVIAAVKEILRNTTDDDAQHDFAAIDPAFGQIVRRLKSKTYFVTSLGEYLSIAELIADPALLDDARRHMRKKGEECLAEAKTLDQLFHAVTAQAESAA